MSNDVMQKKTITKTGISYLNSPTTDFLNLWVTRNLYLPVIAKYTVDIHRGDRSELYYIFPVYVHSLLDALSLPCILYDVLTADKIGLAFHLSHWS